MNIMNTFDFEDLMDKLLIKIKKLNSSEIETLNILLDEKARKALFVGLAEFEEGDVALFER